VTCRHAAVSDSLPSFKSYRRSVAHPGRYPKPLSVSLSLSLSHSLSLAPLVDLCLPPFHWSVNTARPITIHAAFSPQGQGPETHIPVHCGRYRVWQHLCCKRNKSSQNVWWTKVGRSCRSAGASIWQSRASPGWSTGHGITMTGELSKPQLRKYHHKANCACGHETERLGAINSPTGVKTR
jgi:hypothetical protein